MREEIQDAAVKVALNNNSGCLVLPVRTGKSKVGWEIAENFNKTLVSYPNKSIQTSWLQDAEKFNFSLDKVEFTTHISLNKQDLSKFDCIIIDEIDQFSENQWINLQSYLINNEINLYGLTATPPNGRDKTQYLDEYCPIIYQVKLDYTVGILQKDYEIIVHMLNPSSNKDIPLSKGGHWSEKAKISFWDGKYTKSRNFMDMLKLIQSIQNSKTKLNYLKQLSNKLDRCIIFLETKEQCKELGFPSYYSGNKDSDKNLELFQNGKINILTCVKQLSAGISFKNLSKCIILHAYASNNKSHQRLARCLSTVDNEETKAEIHILCLRDTRDESWVKQGLAEFDKNKIKWNII